MKTKFLTLLLLISFSIAVSAQSWQTYENKLYVSPVNTFVGIGTNIPAYNLDIDGRLRIRYSNVINGWGYSYLYWSFHSLVMGTPEGSNSHNSIDLIPGGNDNQPETFFSQIRFFSTTSTNQHDLKIELNSEGNCSSLSRQTIGFVWQSKQASVAHLLCTMAGLTTHIISVSGQRHRTTNLMSMVLYMPLKF